jgi:twitching motility protein PilT
MDVGFVNDPSTKIMSALERFFPGAQIKPFSISYDMFESVMETQAGADIGLGPQTDKEKKDDAARAKASVLATARADKAEILDQLLKKIVAEGASDLHLSANEAPYWRIDGELKPIQGMKVLEGEEVLQLMLPLLDKHSRSEFMKTNDTDFGYTLPGVSRFRINMFRDHKGVGASIRVIPSTIFSFEQLGLPTALKELCNHPKGIVLVTGPTGSGKSTTLAAMIDYINKNRKEHIITLEDPIEFVYQNNLCLIHQREVGDHTQTFARGLRACLREDPDIVLIGELRDLEVIRIALETANTGHLVFGTLHTSTAISSLTRIIDAFPPEEQNQVRTSLSDTIKGVVSQTLCKCIGGGRVAAVEVLVVSTAVSNLILKQKFNQIASYMQTGKEAGNRVLNEELEKLVKRKKISREEAFSKALDKEDLRSRLEAAHVLARQQMSKGGDHD